MLARGRAREALPPRPRRARRRDRRRSFAARAVLDMHLAPRARGTYIVALIEATREPARFGDKLGRWIAFGASPRGTIALDRCARAHAWLAGRDYVTPEDVHAIAPDCCGIACC